MPRQAVGTIGMHVKEARVTKLTGPCMACLHWPSEGAFVLLIRYGHSGWVLWQHVRCNRM